ncbi:AraC family ligand binding domain-containing protein, partial [Proteus mirabilis]|uniref:AraC family ligand binding domain-containing protein n=1 Tax=Proteus mirabilis TaxID=584 RepID=UPI0019544F11
PHRHAKGQIILAQRGALSCEVDGGLWIVPPRSAIWIPGNALHSVKATGALEGYNAFIAPDAAAGLPQGCCALSVSPLLRELIARHHVDCWLVNTGWTGGKHGVGRRMPISITRLLLRSALDGSLNRADFRRDPYFGFAVPTSVPGVPPHMLY